MFRMDENTVTLVYNIFNVSDQFEHGFRISFLRDYHLGIVVVPVVAHIINPVMLPHIGNCFTA